MRTTILAYVIAAMGFLMIAGGIYIFRPLIFARDDEVASLADYVILAAFISGGLSMGGIAQALRLLLEINRKRMP